MFNEFGFQGTSSSKKIEFDRVKFEKEPAKHVIDVCVSQMFYENSNMVKENLNISHTEKIYCGKNVNLLMESFNDRNFNERDRSLIPPDSTSSKDNDSSSNIVPTPPPTPVERKTIPF